MPSWAFASARDTIAGHGVGAASHSSSQDVTGPVVTAWAVYRPGMVVCQASRYWPFTAASVMAGVAVVPSGRVTVRVAVAAWASAPAASRTSNAIGYMPPALIMAALLSWPSCGAT